jgi:hypothetical protein
VDVILIREMIMRDIRRAEELKGSDAGVEGMGFFSILVSLTSLISLSLLRWCPFSWAREGQLTQF